MATTIAAMTTASTTKSTTTPQPTDATCIATDQFGTQWYAKGGQMARQRCPGRESGHVTWRCLPTGTFVGEEPNFEGCATEWIGAIASNVEEAIRNGSLTLSKAAESLTKIEILILG